MCISLEELIVEIQKMLASWEKYSAASLKKYAVITFKLFIFDFKFM